MTPWSTARCSHWLGRMPRRPAGRSKGAATAVSRLMVPNMAVSLYGRAGGLALGAAQAGGRHSPSTLKDFGSRRALFLHTSGLRGLGMQPGVSKQQAEPLTKAVLSALADRLTGGEADDVASQLP